MRGALLVVALLVCTTLYQQLASFGLVPAV